MRVQVDHFQERGVAPHKMKHSMCSLSLQDDVRHFHEARQHSLCEEHLAHLEAQGILTGLVTPSREFAICLGSIPEEHGKDGDTGTGSEPDKAKEDGSSDGTSTEGGSNNAADLETSNTKGK